MTITDWYHLIGIGVIVASATWALRTKLSDIDKSITGHVARDEEVHKAQDARIIKLEGRRGRR